MDSTSSSRIKNVASFILALLVFLSLFFFAVLKLNYSFDFNRLFSYKNLIFKGWSQTILISIISLFISLILGIVIYFLRVSKNKVFNYLAHIYTELIFGTPILVLVIVGHYILGTAYGIRNVFISGVLILSTYISAYISEIYRAGINSIPKEQWEAIQVLGFNKYDTYRYLIFPQVIKNILPPLTSQLAYLIKSSSLLSYLGYSEFFNVMGQIQTNTFASIESYIVLAIGYLILTIPLSLSIKKLEQSFRKDTEFKLGGL